MPRARPAWNSRPWPRRSASSRWPATLPRNGSACGARWTTRRCWRRRSCASFPTSSRPVTMPPCTATRYWTGSAPWRRWRNRPACGWRTRTNAASMATPAIACSISWTASIRPPLPAFSTSPTSWCADRMPTSAGRRCARMSPTSTSRTRWRRPGRWFRPGRATARWRASSARRTRRASTAFSRWSRTWMWSRPATDARRRPGSGSPPTRWGAC